MSDVKLLESSLYIPDKNNFRKTTKQVHTQTAQSLNTMLQESKTIKLL